MATRAHKLANFVTTMTFTVAASQVVTKGKVVKFASADTDVQDAAAGDDNIIGIALESGVAGARVQIFLPGGVIPMLVGTGGSTRGKKQIVVSDGITDAPAQSTAGTTNNVIVGIAVQTGVAVDMIGVIPQFSNRGSA